MRYIFPFVLFLLTLGHLETNGQSVRDGAINFYRTGEYEKAIVIIQKLDEEKAADYLSLTYLGAAYVKTNKMKEAAKVFNQLGTAAPSQSPQKYERKRELLKHPRVYCSGLGSGSFAKVAVELGADGKIGFIFPYSVSQEGFKAKAEDAAKGIQFKPAIVDGKPVSTILLVDYNC